MASERVVEREVPVERDVTVVRDGDGGGSGVSGIVIALILLAALVLGGVFLMNMQRAEAVRTDAVAGAASSVADSASEAAGAVTDAVTPD